MTRTSDKKTCLVVDDSKIIRKICGDILEEIGIAHAEAADGIQAIAYCETNTPSIIILDWNMPVLDGLGFLKRFRTERKNDSTKVIICTTENDITKIQAAMEAGANEYIMKPFDGEIIRCKLQQLGII